jgi:rare lipoprotein A
MVLLVIVQSACSIHKQAEVVSPVAKLPPQELPPDPVPRVEPRSRYGNPSSYIVFGKRYYTFPSSHGFSERGIASWYGKKFHGRKTSSGEVYDMYAMTAAHTQLPLPTYVQVTNLKNSRQVIVRVNDRGPFHNNRVIDLSYSAAARLGIIKEGTGLVEIRALDPLNYRVVQTSKSQTKENANIKKTSIRKSQSKVVAHQVEEPQEQAVVARTADPKVFVQVGAFGDRANANQLSQQLNGLNLGVITISSVIQDAKELHRVRIGPLETVQSADDTVAKLYDMGMKKHRVVIE